MSVVVKQLQRTLLAMAIAVAAGGLWTAGTLQADGPAATQASGAKPATTEVAGIPVSTDARPEVTKLPAAPTLPKTLADLKLIQTRVEAVVKEALPATVSIQFDYAQGSGVIVSKDGYILTAGHVSGTPGAIMKIVLADGRKLHAKALGANNGIDSGMVKIVEAGDYPFVPVGSTKNLTAGQWVVAMGHPLGYVPGRPPVVRLGRVIMATARLIDTDSPLISGDSGGPLFDLDGRLIGINSRIGEGTAENIHVPIDTFVGTWDRLAKGEEWEDDSVFIDLFRAGQPRGAFLGVRGITDESGVRVTKVLDGTQAKACGLQVGDVITKVNGEAAGTSENLAQMVEAIEAAGPVGLAAVPLRRGQRPQVTLTLTVIRDARAMDVTVNLPALPRR